jgi:hypothetical protein
MKMHDNVHITLMVAVNASVMPLIAVNRSLTPDILSGMNFRFFNNTEEFHNSEFFEEVVTDFTDQKLDELENQVEAPEIERIPVDSEALSMILAMGFDSEMAQVALEFSQNDIEGALECITSGTAATLVSLGIENSCVDVRHLGQLCTMGFYDM